MATIKRFEDLEVWKMARELNLKIFPLLQQIHETKNYELRNQLDSSCGSVMDNIAEGFERDGNKEFVQFLAIAKGSLGEVRSQLYRTFDRKLIGEEKFELLNKECLLLAGKIANFMTYLRRSEIKGVKFKQN
jgi:four helix bundle protein